MSIAALKRPCDGGILGGLMRDVCSSGPRVTLTVAKYSRAAALGQRLDCAPDWAYSEAMGSFLFVTFVSASALLI